MFKDVKQKSFHSYHPFYLLFLVVKKESNARNTVRVCKKQNDGYEKYMVEYKNGKSEKLFCKAPGV
jgi:hypothetical protein